MIDWWSYGCIINTFNTEIGILFALQYTFQMARVMVIVAICTFTP